MTEQQPRMLAVRQPGLIDYTAAWDLQRHLVAQRSIDAIPDTLLLLQHPPTYTIGRSGGHEHLRVTPAEIAARGATLIEVDRGGDITYHGPGQLVGYPILQIKQHGRDLHRYLRMLEQVIIDVLAIYDIVGRRFAGYTGVWVADAKIAAIGVRANARGVTSHGFALNISTDLRDFDLIVPCGIADYGVTSLQHILGTPLDVAAVIPQIIDAFARVFDLQVADVPATQQH